MKQLGEAVTTENPYYARISRKLRAAKYITLLFAVICAILILWAYRGGITYDNLRYLLRDMDTAGHTSLSGDTVYYKANETNVYLFFRGDLAVGSSEGIAFHRALGSRSFLDEVHFRAPVLTGSAKYMIAYDSGGNSFYVYNSISRVYDETLDTPVLAAAASDNGDFAILTENKVGSYEIRVYDRNFKKVASLTRSGDVYTIGFLGDGRLWFCELLAENAALCTDFSLYTVGAEDIESTHRESGLILKSGSLKKGYYLLTDRSLVFFDGEGEETAVYSFGTSDVLHADATEDGVAVLLDDNAMGGGYSANAYFANGDTVMHPASKGAQGIALCGKRICVLYDGNLCISDGEGTRETEIPAGGRRLLRQDKNNVIVCMNDYASIFPIG